MHRADFGAWGAALDEGDFWRAVALLGLFSPGLAPGPGGDPQPPIEALLAPPGDARRLDDEPGPVWLIDDALLQRARAGTLVDAGALAALWPALGIAQRLPPRLLSAVLYDNEAEFAALLRRFANLSVVHGLYGESPGDDWQWPLRFALPDEGELAALRRPFIERRRASRTMRRLTRLVPPDAPVVEFLVLPGGLQPALAQLQAAPAPVRAQVLLLAGPLDFDHDPFPLLEALQQLAQCKAVVLVDEPAERLVDWVHAAVRELAHDLPLDRALNLVLPQPPLMFVNPAIHRLARIGRFAERSGQVLDEAGIAGVVLADDEAGPIGLPAGEHRAFEVAAKLRETLRRPDAFDEERRGASWTTRLLTAARRSGALAAPRRRRPSLLDATLDGGFEFAPPRDPRRVQVDVHAGGAPVRHWRAATAHELTVFIAAAGGMLAGPAFPDETLPGDVAGHLLTVTLFAPGFLEQPLLRTIFLPRDGGSTPCRFDFTLGAQRAWFEARVAIAWRNRTLQTLLLRGSVQGVPGAEDRPIELVPEMATQAGFAGLDEQRAYGATLVLNRLGDEKALTLQSGYQVLGFSIQGLDAETDAIEARIDASNWAAPEMRGLGGQGTRELLHFLALHGASLYGAVLRHARARADGAALVRKLQQAGIVQVMAANLGARLPVEFFYANDGPDPDAAICPRHAQRVAREGCADCPHNDVRHFCPLGLWSLGKAIEWHHFDDAEQHRAEFAPREFALQSADADAPRDRLRPIADIVIGASVKAGEVDADCVPAMVRALAGLGIRTHEAADWAALDRLLLEKQPGLVLLLPHLHTDRFGKACLELGGGSRNDLQVGRMDLGTPPGAPGPVLLLLGCNTDNAGVPFNSFPVVFSERASIVISTISHVLGRHAAPLAARLVAAIVQAQRGGTQPPFGEVMRTLRRDGLADEPPIALALKCYGDARWRC